MSRKIIERNATLFLASLAWLASPPLAGQGGPPLITDDTGTPGDGVWEINLAAAAVKRQALWELEAPLADFNYGVGESVQLKLEVPWVTVHRDGEGTKNGLGNTVLGVKWRFLDEESHGVSTSIYPQVEFNSPTSSAERGVVEEGMELFLPLQLQRSFGSFSLNPEVGFALIEKGEEEWVFGLAAGYEAIAETFEILGEVHVVAESDFGADELVFNFGLRWRFWDPLALIFSAGRSLRDSAGGEPEFLAYLGLQVILQGKA
ncbi:MAG: hypothetical protein HY717_10050 [Planctomycetes bacterium]|nr:hypothetical protein [Planctomycetota bacterium]